MRKYQRIWEALKKDLTVTVRVAPELQTRTVLCLRKEKHGDLAFKFLTAEVGNSYKLFHSVDGDLITFTLIPEQSIRNI
jgi:hypothetical protein